MKSLFKNILPLKFTKRLCLFFFLSATVPLLIILLLIKIAFNKEISEFTQTIFFLVIFSFIPVLLVLSWLTYIHIRNGLKIFAKVIVEDNSDLEHFIAVHLPELAPIFKVVKDEAAKLSSTNQQLIDALESIKDGFFRLDNEWRFSYINEEAEQKLFKRKREELLGRSIWDEFPMTVDTMVYHEYLKAIKEQKPITFEVEGIINEWYEVHAYPCDRGLAVYYHNITERKIAENIHLQFTTLVESSADAIIGINLDYTISSWNAGAEKMYGYSKDEIIGQPISILIPPGKAKYEGINQKILQNMDIETFEGMNVRKDGTRVFTSIRISLIRNSNGNVIGLSAIHRDINDKRKLEEELLKTQKIESLGILAGGIAHDFNNILAAIMANLQLAAIKLQKFQDISKYLVDTIEITRKASDLTKQLLTFAKGGDPVKKSVSICNLIKRTVPFALSGSKVKAEFHFPGDLWVVDVDEGQITQVINNLTINAEQAMPTGGILEIYGDNVIFETTDKYTPGHYVKVMVKDHGIGISEEIINKIFDPFFTTKKTGNGLGLSTSYSIIKKHEGYLEVESSPGIGTTFNIYLPTVMGQLAVEESGREIAAGREAKILLMDDEDTIRNVGGEMLTCFGYRVVLASDGREAVELYKKAKQLDDPFDVVIMDLTVPGGLGGIEAIAILRQTEPAIKAIISSGYANSPVTSDYQRYGFCGIVTKPYKFEELIEVLNKVIDKK